MPRPEQLLEFIAAKNEELRGVFIQLKGLSVISERIIKTASPKED